MHTEYTNTNAFRQGFGQTKNLSGGYSLTATPGAFAYSPSKPRRYSDQFRIEIDYKNTLVGWANFKVSNKDGKQKLEVVDIVVDPAHCRKGLASDMHAFAKELGNDIVQSDMQTAAGKVLWNSGKVVMEDIPPELAKKIRNTLPERIKVSDLVSPTYLGKFRNISRYISSDAHIRLTAFSQGRYTPIVALKKNNKYEVIQGEDTLDKLVSTLQLFGRDISDYTINTRVIDVSAPALSRLAETDYVGRLEEAWDWLSATTRTSMLKDAKEAGMVGSITEFVTFVVKNKTKYKEVRRVLR